MEFHGNWQHRVHKMKENKAKTQHNTCWTSLCPNKYKYNDHNAPLRKYTIKYLLETFIYFAFII